MYVCMYVCMFVCMYLFMYVSVTRSDFIIRTYARWRNATMLMIASVKNNSWALVALLYYYKRYAKNIYVILRFELLEQNAIDYVGSCG